MLLSDRDLSTALQDGRLQVSLFHEEMMQPASIDVRLGRRFRVFNTSAYQAIDPALEQPGLTSLVELGMAAGDDVFTLQPGEFVLGTTLERVQLADGLAARLEGKSSLGRLGLLVHSTAGFVDPGFGGKVTLELSNVNRMPILLRPGMFIGQLCVFLLSSPAEHPYGSAGLGSRYQGQQGPTESRSWQLR